MFVAVCIQNDA